MDRTLGIQSDVTAHFLVTGDAGGMVDDLGEPAATMSRVDIQSTEAESHPLPFSGLLRGTAITMDEHGAVTWENPADGFAVFFYRLTNASGTSTGSCTVVVGHAPLAGDDTWEVSAGQTSELRANNGDDAGSPYAYFVSFGGGDAGGTVESHSIMDQASFAGGILSVTETGTFTLTGDTRGGVFHFQYARTNALGTTVGNVTVTILQPPEPRDDALNVLVDHMLVANVLEDHGNGPDLLGYPVATVEPQSYVGSSTGESVTLAADGTLTFTANEAGRYLVLYRLVWDGGSNYARVTVDVGMAPPVAVSDGPFTVLQGATLVVGDDEPTLLANDDLGAPAGKVDAFGIRYPRDSAAGSTVAFAGGLLTVDAAGVATLEAPTNCGPTSFTYTVRSWNSFSTATVAVNVEGPPQAQALQFTSLDDAFPYNQVPLVVGDQASQNVYLPGMPVAAVVSVGGGDLGGDVTTFAVPTAMLPLAGGTIQVTAAGMLELRGIKTAGQYSFDYKLTNIHGSSSNTITLTVKPLPVAVMDTYVVVQDTSILVGAPGVLANDILNGAVLTRYGDPNNLSTSGQAQTQRGGLVEVSADGAFQYAPPAGYLGEDYFYYLLANTNGSRMGAVALRVQVPPVANPDQYRAQDGSASQLLNPSVLTNDGRQLARLTSYGATGTEQTVLGQPAITTGGATVEVDADGVITYHQVSSGGVDTFSYVLTNDLGSSTGLVTITLEHTNVAPVIHVPPGLQVARGNDLSFGNAISVTDVDAGSAVVRVTLQSADAAFQIRGYNGSMQGITLYPPGLMLELEMPLLDANTFLAGFLWLQTATRPAGSIVVKVSAFDFGNTGLGGAGFTTAELPVTVQ